MFSIHEKGANAIAAITSVVDNIYYLLHNLLCKVRSAFETNAELLVYVFAKQPDNHIKFLAGLVKLKYIVLHGYVKFCKKLYPIIWSNISVMTG